MSTSRSAWNLAANPVLRRYAVPALRPVRLIIAIVITQLIAAFLWFTGLLGAVYSTRLDEGGRRPESYDEIVALVKENPAPGAITAWLLILILQSLLSYVGGTARVATGVAGEAQDGMDDALRLTPVPPLQKLLDQWIGLPIRTSVSTLCLLPWAIFSFILGDLPWAILGRVYLIFTVGALMHHALGLAAGTFIKQKILAGTLSQVAVLSLHFILPIIGVLGLGMLGHFGFFTAVGVELASVVPIDSPLYPAQLRTDFFSYNVSIFGYHLLVTILALAFLLHAVHRRWVAANSQLFGKPGTLLFAFCILFFTCGEMLPQLSELPKNEIINSLSLNFSSAEIAQFWLYLLATLFGIFIIVLASLLVPSKQTRTSSLLSGAKRKKPWDDSSSPYLWITALALFASVAWGLLSMQLAKSLEGLPTPKIIHCLLLSASYLLLVILTHFYRSALGTKRFLLVVFFVGFVPIMLATLVILARADSTWFMWIYSLSPLILPALAVAPPSPYLLFSLILNFSALLIVLGPAAATFVSRRRQVKSSL